MNHNCPHTTQTHENPNPDNNPTEESTIDNSSTGNAIPHINVKNKAMIGFSDTCKTFFYHISALTGKMSSFPRYQLVAYHNTIIGLTIQMRQNWIVRRELRLIRCSSFFTVSMQEYTTPHNPQCYLFCSYA